MATVKVISATESEEETLRAFLGRRHGIAFDTARFIELPAGFSFTTKEAILYSYTKPSSGERYWLIELEVFTPPDAQRWRTWVLDSEPTDEQALLLMSSNAQAGSFV